MLVSHKNVMLDGNNHMLRKGTTFWGERVTGEAGRQSSRVQYIISELRLKPLEEYAVRGTPPIPMSNALGLKVASWWFQLDQEDPRWHQYGSQLAPDAMDTLKPGLAQVG